MSKLLRSVGLLAFGGLIFAGSSHAAVRMGAISVVPSSADMMRPCPPRPGDAAGLTLQRLPPKVHFDGRMFRR